MVICLSALTSIRLPPHKGARCLGTAKELYTNEQVDASFQPLAAAIPQPRGCGGGKPSGVMDLGVDEKARGDSREVQRVQMWQAGMPILGPNEKEGQAEARSRGAKRRR